MKSFFEKISYSVYNFFVFSFASSCYVNLENGSLASTKPLFLCTCASLNSWKGYAVIFNVNGIQFVLTFCISMERIVSTLLFILHNFLYRCEILQEIKFYFARLRGDICIYIEEMKILQFFVFECVCICVKYSYRQCYRRFMYASQSKISQVS